jgi:hypothetical protein
MGSARKAQFIQQKAKTLKKPAVSRQPKLQDPSRHIQSARELRRIDYEETKEE